MPIPDTEANVAIPCVKCLTLGLIGHAIAAHSPGILDCRNRLKAGRDERLAR